MNQEHLEYILEMHYKDNNIIVGDVISDYTRLAISYSYDGFTPCEKDYNKAFSVIKEKYINNEYQKKTIN